MRKTFFQESDTNRATDKGQPGTGQGHRSGSGNRLLRLVLILSAATLWMYTPEASPLSANPAQVNPVTGRVTGNGEPLIGATIKIKESNTGVVTDLNGNYSIHVSQGQTLVFSYVGFSDQEVIVTQRVINVALEEETKLLDEVIIIPYGMMRRSDMTGAVTSVSATEISRSINTSLDQALQGRAAGVMVTQNSGAPGGGISVSIRGINSFTGNEPLYVIDGITIDGQKEGNSSALSNINPSDIQSMEILKDASATAIYGTRAANGVVLITTKKGEVGATRITYEGYYGVQQLPNRLAVLDLREYAVYQNLRAQVIGFGAREEFKDPSLLGKGTNWQKEIFRSAPVHNHQITVSGGNENNKFAIMGGYIDQEGIAIGSGFERYSLRLNMDTQIRKWMKLGVNSYVSSRRQVNTVDEGSIIETAIRQLPEVPVKNADGSWGSQQENMYGTYFNNPVADALSRENYNRSSDVQIRGYADLTLLKGLVFRAEASASLNYYTQYDYTPLMEFTHFTQASSSQRRSSNNSYVTFSTYLTYDKQIELHRFSAMAGHESQEGKYEDLSGSRKGYIFNSIHELNVGDAQTAKNGSSRSSNAIESYYGRLNYNFDERYMITATLRRDGSSNFSENHRWGAFPSAAIAWRINNEGFMREVKVINNLKLRLGWGIVGNQGTGGYAYGVTMTSSATPGGQGFFPGNFSNPDLKWERTKAYNAGIDVNLFKNRIEFIADFYKKDIDNLLMPATLPSYVAGVISSPWVNAGSMTNKGMEFTLNTVNISNRAFSWNSGLTFSLNRNKVTELYTGSAGEAGMIGGLVYTYSAVGRSFGEFYGYRVIGMFKEEKDFYKQDRFGNNILDEHGERIPVAITKDVNIGVNGVWVGDFIYEDRNNDGKIDEEDRTFIGNPEPKFSFGLNNHFTYRDFDLNIFLNGVYGNKIYNILRERYTDPMQNSGMLKEATRIARLGLRDPEGASDDLSNVYVTNPDASIQRIWVTDANSNNRTSDRFVEDGSYLRIKNLSLGYTVPKKILSRFLIDNLRFYVNIQNLHTFTNYTGYDPEVGAYNYDMKLRNIDNARYPSQRIYTFGLNVTF